MTPWWEEIVALRYIAKTDFFCADRDGRRRFYSAKHPGYLPEQVKGLSRDHLKMFRKFEVEEVVEQATAAPGEKRAVGRFGCDECEFASKSAAGLVSHQRVHEE
jgi:hypothetical protein